MTLRSAHEKPVYVRLREVIADAILAGRYGDGDSLPSVRALAAEQGAHHVLDHRAEGYLEELTRLTGGRGPGVILEMLANVNLNRDLEVIAKGGRVVVNNSGALTTSGNDSHGIFGQSVGGNGGSGGWAGGLAAFGGKSQFGGGGLMVEVNNSGTIRTGVRPAQSSVSPAAADPPVHACSSCR